MTTLLWFSLLPALLLCLTLVSFFLVRVLRYPKCSNCLQFQGLYICSSVYSFQFPSCPKFHLLASLRNTQCLILMVSSFSSRTRKWSACLLSYKAPILTLALQISLIQDNPFRRWTIFSLCCSICEPPARFHCYLVTPKLPGASYFLVQDSNLYLVFKKTLRIMSHGI